MEKLNKKHCNQYEKERRVVDESFRISKYLSSLLSTCLRKKKEKSKLEKTLDILQEIDHILPKSHFDHCNEEELSLCWNWRNLHPVTKAENRMKGNKIDYHLYYNNVSLAAEFLEKVDQDGDEDFLSEDSDSELDSDFIEEFASMELFD